MDNTPINKRTTLTPRQREIYEFLQDAILNRGYGPTVREIGDRFGIRSPNGVLCHLHAMEKKGFISREPSISRSIIVRDKPQRATTLEFRGELRRGTPPTVDNCVSQVDFLDLFGCGDHFCYFVSDNSLADEHILEGDYLICRVQKSYRDGDQVIAELDDGETSYKRFFQLATAVRLESISDPTSSVQTDHVKILGLVLGVVRKL